MSLLPHASKETIRAFIAIPVPEGIIGEVVRFRNALANELPNAKWAKPEGFHITLKFLGEITIPVIEKVKQVMDESAGGWRDFEMSLGGTGVFPEPARARVLWVGATAGNVGCNRIFRSLEAPLGTIGFKMEKRPFKVHITLARFRKPGSVPEKVLKSQFSSTSFFAKKVVLYQSTLHTGGAVYNPLHTIKLSE